MDVYTDAVKCCCCFHHCMLYCMMWQGCPGKFNLNKRGLYKFTYIIQTKSEKPFSYISYFTKRKISVFLFRLEQTRISPPSLQKPFWFVFDWRAYSPGETSQQLCRGSQLYRLIVVLHISCVAQSELLQQQVEVFVKWAPGVCSSKLKPK